MISLTLDLTSLHPAAMPSMVAAITLPWLARVVRPVVRLWMETRA